MGLVGQEAACQFAQEPAGWSGLCWGDPGFQFWLQNHRQVSRLSKMFLYLQNSTKTVHEMND